MRLPDKANRTGPQIRRFRNGFTLIELLTVIFIIAVMLAISFPSFGRMRESAALRSGARAVVAAFRHARDVAVTRQSEARLAIGEGGRSYRIESMRRTEAGSQEFIADRNPLGRERALPPGVLAEVQRPDAQSEGQFVSFFMDGSSESAIVTLTHRSGHRISVSLNGLSGRTSVSGETLVTDTSAPFLGL